MKFWKRFYNLCEIANKKPNTVCTELGFSSATATHWKNGAMPKGDALLLLSDYFDCSVDYLLGRTAEPNGVYVYQTSNSGNIVNGNNGDNSPLTVNGKAPHNDDTDELVDLVKGLPLVKRAEAVLYLNELKNKK